MNGAVEMTYEVWQNWISYTPMKTARKIHVEVKLSAIFLQGHHSRTIGVYDLHYKNWLRNEEPRMKFMDTFLYHS